MKKRRIGSLLLAAALAFSGLSVPAKAAEEQSQSDLAVHYDMTHEGEYLKDVSGNNHDAKMYNIEDTDFQDVYGDAVLKFPGTNESYVALPVSIKEDLNYQEAFTIEMTLRPETAQFQFLWTIGTGFQTDYLFFNPRLANGSINVAIKTDAVNQENSIPGVGDVQLNTHKYSLVTVTSEGNTLKLYVNGNAIGTLNHAHNLDDIFGGNEEGVLGYLAKSNWNDPYCDAEVTDFKIYNKTLTEEEVKENYTEMEALQSLKADADSVSLPEYTFEDLELPSKGARGSSVTWKSSAPEVISADGKIQAGISGTTEVTFTASFKDSASGMAIDKNFKVQVIADGEQGRLEYVAEKFDLGITYVTDDITLPEEFEGLAISWEGNELITNEGKVTRPDEDTEVVLKAEFSYGGAKVSRNFPVTVAAKPAGYLATYIALYEYNMGSEEALKPTNFDENKETNYTNNERTDVMHYALSKDGKEYTALNHSKAVLYPTGLYKMGSPSLFRKPDGTYGAIASVDNNSTEILVYDSEDLIFFENQRKVELNTQGIIVKNPTVKYDNGTKEYAVFWEGGDGKSYKSVTKDFTSFSVPEAVQYQKETVSGTLPKYASAAESSQFELTAQEYDRLEKKFGDIYSTSVNGQVSVSADGTETEESFTWDGKENGSISVKPGSKITLPEQIQVAYNDGSDADMNIAWDDSALDLSKEGTYEITGTISSTSYESPLVECRADPQIVYNEKDGMYYFTGSYMNGDNEAGRGHYDSIILRKASTINGLKDAEEVRIWWGEREDGIAPGAYWAPELHYFGGKWRIISMAGWGADRQGIFTCEGDDLMDPDNWGFSGYIDVTETNHETQTSRVNNFDTTFFELNGTCYYVTPKGADWKGALWITTFDPDNPTVLTSDPVIISRGDMAFETNVLQNGQNIQEGSAVLFHDDKIFIAYACATVDQFYASNVIYADIDADLMDPDSWSKYPYPLLSTADLTTTVEDPDYTTGKKGSYSGTFGPGHNSFTVDENGNPVIVYHARAWGESYVDRDEDRYGLFDAGRHAYANSVHFGADGFPIFNMTAEQILSEELKTVTLTVKVEKAAEPDPDPTPDPDPQPTPDPTPDPDPKLPYVDVEEGDWFYDGAYYNYFAGTMTGTDTTHFSPYEILPRAQFATILHRMEGKPDAAYTNRFPDVPDGQFYSTAVLWAAEAKVVTGYTDSGYFGTNDPITREQMVVMMYRYADYKKYDISKSTDISSFSDAGQVSEFAEKAMKWAVENGIIEGKKNTDGSYRLDPQGSTSRAECAIIIQRFMEKFGK